MNTILPGLSELLSPVPRPIANLEMAALAVVDQMVESHGPSKLYALFSGGHDSLATTHLVSHHPLFRGVVHINTGIGIPETRQFVRDTCHEHGWPLHEIGPGEGQMNYLQVIIRHGFPGPAFHETMYRQLKEKPLMKLLTELKEPRDRLDRVAFAGGVRADESERRMGNLKLTHRRGACVWVSPIHDWTGIEVTAYVTHHELMRNPVRDRLHLSGECLCGCYAEKGERQEIATWYPHVDQEIARLEEVLRLAVALRVGDIAVEDERLTWGWGAYRQRPHLAGSGGLLCRRCSSAAPDAPTLPGLDAP